MVAYPDRLCSGAGDLTDRVERLTNLSEKALWEYNNTMLLLQLTRLIELLTALLQVKLGLGIKMRKLVAIAETGADSDWTVYYMWKEWEQDGQYLGSNRIFILTPLGALKNLGGLSGISCVPQPIDHVMS